MNLVQARFIMRSPDDLFTDYDRYLAVETMAIWGNTASDRMVVDAYRRNMGEARAAKVNRGASWQRFFALCGDAVGVSILFAVPFLLWVMLP